jgi:hypothetical protein
MQPYAPPRADVLANGTVDVDVTKPLPSVCLKCGGKKDVSPRPETLHILTARARVIVVVLVLFAIAAFTLFESLELRVAVFVGVVVAGRVVRMGAGPVMPKVDVGLPLCVSCDDRWTSGMKRRRVYRALILGLVALLLVSVALSESPVVGLLFFPPILGLVVANALLRLRSRLVVATALSGDVVTLSGVSAEAVAAIREATSR